MRGRAFRRHQRERIKQRVQHYYHGYAAGSARHIGKLAQTPHPLLLLDVRQPPLLQRRTHPAGTQSQPHVLTTRARWRGALAQGQRYSESMARPSSPASAGWAAEHYRRSIRRP